MTRTERAWHWRLWLLIAPVLAGLFVLALMHRPAVTSRTAPPRAAQEARP